MQTLVSSVLLVLRIKNSSRLFAKNWIVSQSCCLRSLVFLGYHGVWCTAPVWRGTRGVHFTRQMWPSEDARFYGCVRRFVRVTDALIFFWEDRRGTSAHAMCAVCVWNCRSGIQVHVWLSCRHCVTTWLSHEVPARCQNSTATPAYLYSSTHEVLSFHNWPSPVLHTLLHGAHFTLRLMSCTPWRQRTASHFFFSFCPGKPADVFSKVCTWLAEDCLRNDIAFEYQTYLSSSIKKKIILRHTFLSRRDKSMNKEERKVLSWNLCHFCKLNPKRANQQKCFLQRSIAVRCYKQEITFSVLAGFERKPFGLFCDILWAYLSWLAAVDSWWLD